MRKKLKKTPARTKQLQELNIQIGKEMRIKVKKPTKKLHRRNEDKLHVQPLSEQRLVKTLVIDSFSAGEKAMMEKNLAMGSNLVPTQPQLSLGQLQEKLERARSTLRGKKAMEESLVMQIQEAELGVRSAEHELSVEFKRVMEKPR